MPRPMLKMPEQETKTQTRTQTTTQSALLLRQPQTMLRTRTDTRSELLIRSADTQQRTKATLNQMQIERVLNKKRSQKYIDAMKRLDAGGHMHNREQVQAIIDIIREELPEIEIDMGPIGIVSKCYLGAPYEVHTLDVTGSIIEHYETYRSMPSGLEKARVLARSGQYEFIEVYTHALRAVSSNGSVAVLKE